METETLTREKHSLIASERVEGTTVRRADGSKVGTIERLMIDKISGNVAYAVLVHGGFLGINEKRLPVPWSMLHYDPALGAYQVEISDEEFAKAPVYEKDFDWGDRTREIEIHKHYKVPYYWGAY